MNQDEALDPNTTPERLWALSGGSPSLLELPDATSDCSLILLSIGNNKQRVLEELCSLVSIYLREANELANQTPSILLEGASLRAALDAWRRLCVVGARAQLTAPGLTFNDALCPFLAQNPNAPESLLWYLALHPDPRTLEAIVQNPGAPLALLGIVAPCYPKALLENPLLPLLQLEDPCLRQLPEELLLSLSGEPEVVLALLPAMMRSEECKLAAFSELSLFPDVVIEALARDQVAVIRSVVARFLAGASRWWGVLVCDEDSRVRSTLAENINAPPATLLRLLYDEEPFIREIARDNRSRGYVFDAILRDPESDAASLELLAARLYTTQDPEQSGLVCLVEPEHWPVRCQQLAQHKNTPLGRLEELWQRGDKEAWLGLARNPKTPSYMIEVMSYSQDEELLDSLLDNESAPVSFIVERLEKLLARVDS